jgi:cyclic pyranopterin phosphate synthase
VTPDAGHDAGGFETVARGRVHMQPSTVAKVVENGLKKGDVLGTARFAGILAASRAPELLPDSSRIPDPRVAIEFDVADEHIDIVVTCRAWEGPAPATQALTGALVCALTIFDMCKAVDHTMVIDEVALSKV